MRTSAAVLFEIEQLASSLNLEVQHKVNLHKYKSGGIPTRKFEVCIVLVDPSKRTGTPDRRRTFKSIQNTKLLAIEDVLVQIKYTFEQQELISRASHQEYLDLRESRGF